MMLAARIVAQARRNGSGMDCWQRHQSPSSSLGRGVLFQIVLVVLDGSSKFLERARSRRQSSLFSIWGGGTHLESVSPRQKCDTGRGSSKLTTTMTPDDESITMVTDLVGRRKCTLHCRINRAYCKRMKFEVLRTRGEFPIGFSKFESIVSL